MNLLVTAIGVLPLAVITLAVLNILWSTKGDQPK